ncbi:MAG: ABC transporter substrate-binding protein [Dehalococcoidia bacterium]|nr:ABC transporter substrate-binding protein [Dehalococcoidia bacterium]
MAMLVISAALAACTSEEEPAPAQPAPAQPAPAATTAPAPAPTAAPAPAQPAPEAMEQSDTLTVVMKSTGAPVFRNGKLPWPSSTFLFGYGFAERLGTVDADYKPTQPMLATSWEMAEDQSEVIVNLRDDVEFHQDWGKMTAADVVYSYNDANVTTNPESRWDDAGEISVVYKDAEVIDDQTVRLVVQEFQAVWTDYIARSPLVIFSKKVYDDKGPDEAANTLVGTGPYEVIEWIEGDKIDAEAVQDHWRVTPYYSRLRVLEVPENATRVSMMRTGEADIAQIPVKDIADLLENYGASTLPHGGSTGHGVWFAGNYIHPESPVSGDPVSREGFTPDADHPWIGDPSDPASLENARKFRTALSMAIDREAINDVMLGGLGEPNYAMYAPRPGLDGWDERWRLDFDPDQAKAMLAEIGIEEGFSFPFYVPPDSVVVPEIGEAVAEMWRNIGLEPEVFNMAYTAHRPRLVERTLNYPWLFVNPGADDPMDLPRAPLWTQVESGANPGLEDPQLYDLYFKAQATDDEAEVAMINEEIIDYAHERMYLAAIASVPGLFTFRAETVKDWPLDRYSPINNLEYITGE